MDFFLAKMCWKNVWRNKRRTFITINSIALGVMILVGLYNYFDAFHEQLISNVIQYQSGHAIISDPEYADRKNPKHYLNQSSVLAKTLNKDPRVKTYSSRVRLQGMISSPRGSANLAIMGVEAEREAQTTQFASHLKEGNFLTGPSDRPIVIGVKLAEQLKVKKGSKVVVLTQGIDGSIGNELFKVDGIFQTDSTFDQRLAFIPIEKARELLSLPPTAIHSISVVLNTQKSIPAFLTDIKKDYPKLSILGWQEVQKHLMAIIELEKGVNLIVMWVILLIAAFGIANAILMSILERTKEFGVMMAIGTTKKMLIQMVIGETLLLSSVGIALGNIFGMAITFYFSKVGFDLKWLSDQPLYVAGKLIQSVSYPTIVWENSLSITLSILFLSLLASFIPILHISKLKAVKAIRS